MLSLMGNDVGRRSPSQAGRWQLVGIHPDPRGLQRPSRVTAHRHITRVRTCTTKAAHAVADGADDRGCGDIQRGRATSLAAVIAFFSYAICQLTQSSLQNSAYR